MVHAIVNRVDVRTQTFVPALVEGRDDVLVNCFLIADDRPHRPSCLECPIKCPEKALPEGRAIRLAIRSLRVLVIRVEYREGENRKIESHNSISYK